jgi:hypothetical protein
MTLVERPILSTSRFSATSISATSTSATVVLSRRGFLRAGAITSGALIGAGLLGGCVRSSPALDDEHPEVLSRRELAILAAIAERVITPADGTPTARDARVARRIDRELVFNEGTLAGDVRAALALVEYSPFLDLRLRPFTRLPAEEQDAHLQACAQSVWTTRRNAFSGLRFLCLFFYYSDDRTWRSIGYDGTMVDRKLPEAANAREVLDQPLGSART